MIAIRMNDLENLSSGYMDIVNRSLPIAPRHQLPYIRPLSCGHRYTACDSDFCGNELQVWIPVNFAAKTYATANKNERFVMSTKIQLDDLEAVKKVVEAIKEFSKDDQERILRWSREKLNLGVGNVPTPAVSQASAADVVAHPRGNAPLVQVDIKSFAAQKAPPSDTQFAAVVAYFHRFESAVPKESISSSDLIEACRTVGRPRINNPAQTLVNAHRQGLLDRGERGEYKINTVGENLVAMALPSDGTSTPTKRRSRKPAGKAAKKATKKKTNAKK